MFDNEITAQQAQLQQWFAQKSATELTNIVMAYVNASDNETSKWQLAMLNEQSGADGLSVASLEKMIAKALPEDSVWSWDEVGAYFDHTDEMFEEIFNSIDKLSIDKQWQLVLHALVRLNKVLEQIDDSGGFRFNLEGELNKRLYTLFNQQTWPDDEKAQWIFEHYKTWKYDVFPSVPEDFELSNAVNHLFIKLCDAEATKLINAGVDLSRWQEKNQLQRLISPQIKLAEQNNDWQEQCRLMVITAYTLRDYLAISQFCLDNDSTLDAEHWLQKAYVQAKSSQEINSCKKLEIILRIELKEYQQAWQLGWQVFTSQPSFHAYKELMALEKNTGVFDPDLFTKTEQLLNQCYVENNYGGISHNADALLMFYLFHDEIEKARNWVLSHKAAPEGLLKLADIIISSHPQEAVNLYYRVVITRVAEGNNQAYQQANELLLTLAKLLKNNHSELLNAMVSNVIKQHKAKRNMMKLLKEHFQQCF